MRAAKHLLLFVAITFTPSSPAALHMPLLSHRMCSAPEVAQCEFGIAALRGRRYAISTLRCDSIRMRDDDSNYISQSMDAWAKTAATRPVFFAVRVAILSAGVYFFAQIALALVQRVL